MPIRLNKSKRTKRDYRGSVKTPFELKVGTLGVLIALAGMAFLGARNQTKKAEYRSMVDEPRQLMTRGSFPDLTPYPSWSAPLYDDSGVAPAETFLNSPARSMTARDSPLPVHAHMEKYDVRYDGQQQDMINRNLREQFGRWKV